MKRKILIVMLLALKRLLRNGSVTLTIRYGPNKGLLWKFSKNSNNEFILGTWEMPMQEVFQRYVKANDVVYDLGAHQGFLALIVSRLVGEKGKVYAFEPLPANFDFLKENVRINNITNCIAFYGAVSDKPGIVNFSTSEADVSNTDITSSLESKEGRKYVEVPAFSLDNLLASGSLTPPQFIKIDVEGAELDVLKGASRLLKELSPLVYLETHNIHNPGVDSACRDFLVSIGYGIKEELITHNEEFGSYIFQKS